MRKGLRFIATSVTVAVLAVGLLSAGASAGDQTRSQSGKSSNDACLNAWDWSAASYRVDWTSYYDEGTLITYYGYVANASNTAGGTLDGVDVVATPADLVGVANTDPKPPVATVALDMGSPVGLPIGAIGFYGRGQVVTNDMGLVEGQAYPLDTYSASTGKALGSYTVCYFGGRS